jgi:hypothetical protein
MGLFSSVELDGICTVNKKGLCRNPEFSTNGKAPVYGWDSAYPREPPFALRLCHITFSGVIALGVCHSGGGGGITFCSPKKSVKKNILRISHEIKLNRSE